MDLKEGKESAVEYFYNLIDAEIRKEVTICVVPSSNMERKESGIGKLGEKLAQNGRVNKVYFLIREKSISKLATGGARDKQIHMESIGTVEDEYSGLVETVSSFV